MSFRDDDDDTSPGKFTQGGRTPRRGHAVWLLFLAAVIAIAAAVWMLSAPHKRSTVEGEGVSASPARPTAPGAGAPASTP